MRDFFQIVHFIIHNGYITDRLNQISIFGVHPRKGSQFPTLNHTVVEISIANLQIGIGKKVLERVYTWYFIGLHFETLSEKFLNFSLTLIFD